MANGDPKVVAAVKSVAAVVKAAGDTYAKKAMGGDRDSMKRVGSAESDSAAMERIAKRAEAGFYNP